MELYDKINYSDIEYYSFNEITQRYFYLGISSEKNVPVQKTNKLWKKYEEYIDLEKLLNIDVVKFSSNNSETKISIRYKNNTNIDNDTLLVPFIDKLLNNNFKEKLNTNKKKRYLGRCDITVYYEFDYIILVVEEG